MIVCPDELKKRYREGRLIPFIGAGISRSVKWTADGVEKRGPSWKDMVDQAIHELGFAVPDLLRVRGTDLQILEYFQMRNGGEFSRLTNWLVRNMHPPDEALKNSLIHHELAALKDCRLIYTTNYDDFIERSFALNGRACHEVVIEDHMQQNRSESEIIKFHGSWNFPKTMVISESHYEERLKLKTCLDHRLRSDLLGNAVLFIGYSFRDPNVSYIFRLMKDEFGPLPLSAAGRRAYIAVSEPSGFECKLFLERQIEVIHIGSQDPVGDIVKLLTEVRSYA
ncbi:MAG: SIR2 family protein [Verrucomicrobia bacterium]|nr:SIR2 family protein [Verrucomicrobiota bacterium]